MEGRVVEEGDVDYADAAAGEEVGDKGLSVPASRGTEYTGNQAERGGSGELGSEEVGEERHRGGGVNNRDAIARQSMTHLSGNWFCADFDWLGVLVSPSQFRACSSRAYIL